MKSSQAEEPNADPSEPHEANRGKRRFRRATLTGVTAIAVRGITTLANLLTIPITAQYLGVERFGVWLTLSMLLTWVSLTDLGLASSLTNLLAAAEAQKQPKQAQTAVSNVFWMTCAIALLLSTVFAIAYPHVPWASIFNVKSAAAISEIGLAVIVFFIGFVLRLPLAIAGRIYTAYQAGYYYQIWSGLSSLISVVALLIAIHFKVGLPLLVGIFFGASLFAEVLSNLHVFVLKWRWLLPQWQQLHLHQAYRLLKLGIQFWIVQISAILLFQTDLIIVTQLFGAKTVAVYGTILKLFTLLGTIQTAFLFPLWPAYSEALTRQDIPWIISTFKKTIKWSLVWSISTGIILSIFSEEIVTLWLGQDLRIDSALIPSMLLTSIFLALGHCVGTLLNGLGKLKIQVIFGFAAGITNLVLSVAFGRWIGTAGVSLATALCLLVFSLGIIGIYTLRTLQSLRTQYRLMHGN